MLYNAFCKLSLLMFTHQCKKPFDIFLTVMVIEPFLHTDTYLKKKVKMLLFLMPWNVSLFNAFLECEPKIFK